MTATHQYTVPKVHGDPAAARAMAASYSDLADAVRTAARQVQEIVNHASAYWSGEANRAADAPAEQILHDAAALAAVLDKVAAALDEYAAKLEHAHHHHGFSLHKLVKIGAVVVVSVAAITVTMGAAGAVEAAAATAAVADATEAAGAATTASAVAATGIFDAIDVMSALRPLLQFVLPHLVQVEWSTMAVGAWDELTEDRLSWKEIGVTGALTLTGSGVAGRVEKALSGAPAFVSTGAQSGVWAGVDATDDEILRGRVDGWGVLESFAIADLGTTAHDALLERDIIFHPPRDYLREALIQGKRWNGRMTDPALAWRMATLRHADEDLLRGDVDLYVDEGPGHTLRKHIGRSAVDLQRRMRAERPRLRRASSYWNERDAHDAVAYALRHNQSEVREWLRSGSTRRLRLYARVPFDVGPSLDRKNRIRVLRMVCVVLHRDAFGPYVLTSFPELLR